MANTSRRQFIKTTLAAGTASVAAPAFISELRAAGPNDTLQVGVIGCNGRGQSHIGGLNKRHGCKVTRICDCDEKVGTKAVEKIKKSGVDCSYVKDMRKLFDDKEIDVITTATPNHWHALASIWAMQAGKDVYVEKPVCHNVSEGRRMVQVARKYNKICQTGTQNRTHQAHNDAIKFLREGGIGTCNLARAICYKRRKSIGPPGNYDPPEGLDYNLWQGPASERPITRKKFHYDWHWQYHWGNGDMGNQAPHQIDLCRWALDVDSLSEQVISYGGRLGYEDAGDVANTQVAIHNFDGGKKTLIIEVRGLESDNYRGANWFGYCLHGSDGYIVMNDYHGGKAYDKDGKVTKTFSGGGDHFGNFVKAVRSRNHKDLNADILEGHLSAGLAHTATVSYLLGEKAPVSKIKDAIGQIKSLDDQMDTLDRCVAHLKKNNVDLEKTPITIGPMLTMDPAKEVFTNNDAANKLLTREYRKPFVVPAENEI
ncbi:MAG: Gfo/Idh/MocA family oxidoreductase [Pirellulales bacterium]|nr:Gfo/Idh/MocA family oxidoreductase [Pirellulales bacterium]